MYSQQILQRQNDFTGRREVQSVLTLPLIMVEVRIKYLHLDGGKELETIILAVRVLSSSNKVVEQRRKCT